VLDVRVRRRLGSFALDAALTVPEGNVTVVVGESGSGKSTLLRLIAGLIEPDSGRITLRDRVLVDVEARRFVPPESRPIGYVPQDYALFPHLNVRDNVAFGPRAIGMPRAAARARADATLERFGLVDLAARKPLQLSGGQQQRVALARALALDPEILLLDEPLAALDPVTRRSVRSELRRTLSEIHCATVFVTHHPMEALAFGERIAVMEDGRIAQCGPRHEFVRRPASAYVAEFLGVNLFEGDVSKRLPDGLAMVAVGDGMVTVPDPGPATRVRVLVHPHDLVVSRDRPEGSARNVFVGSIDDLVPEPPAGERVRVLLASRPPLAAQVTRSSVEALGLEPGIEVFVSFKATAVQVLPI
jgi:molybdate transport system ATP-binding protein